MSEPSVTRDLAHDLAGLSISNIQPTPNVYRGYFQLPEVKMSEDPDLSVLDHKQDIEVHSKLSEMEKHVCISGEMRLSPNEASIDAGRRDSTQEVPSRLLHAKTVLGFSQFEMSDLIILADLAQGTKMVLFSPVVWLPNWNKNPSGQTLGPRPERMSSGDIPQDGTDNHKSHLSYDPFEDFGRSLSIFHHGICHVPYLIDIVFTKVHATFVAHADSVVTIICEPGGNNSQPEESLKRQMAFAQTAHTAILHENAVDRHDPRLSMVNDRVEILVQCASSRHRTEIPDMFRNVIEAPEYTSIVAKELAELIFARKK